MHLEDVWELNQWCSGRDTRSDEDREVERLQRRWRRMFRFRTPTADERMAVEIELCYAQRGRADELRIRDETYQAWSWRARELELAKEVGVEKERALQVA